MIMIIMITCRITSINDAKTKPPQWILEMPWRDGHTAEDADAGNDDDDEEEEEDEEPVEKPKKEKKKKQTDINLAKTISSETEYVWGAEKVVMNNEDYLFGYSKEMKQAFRVLKTDRKQRRVPSMKIVKPKDGGDSAQMIAQWSDGMEEPIPCMTVREWKEITAGRGSREGKEFWCGEHKSTKHRLRVHLRLDKEPSYKLISLKEQARQIAQVAVWMFDENQKETDAAQEVASTFMVEKVAKPFAKGKVAIEDLKTHLKTELEKHFDGKVPRLKKKTPEAKATKDEDDGESSQKKPQAMKVMKTMKKKKRRLGVKRIQPEAKVTKDEDDDDDDKDSQPKPQAMKAMKSMKRKPTAQPEPQPSKAMKAMENQPQPQPETFMDFGAVPMGMTDDIQKFLDGPV